MTRFNKYQKLAMVSLPLAIMLNPMTIQIYLDYVVYVLEFIGGVATVYLIVFLLYKVLKPEPVNIPKGKTKTSKFIET